MTMIRGTVSRDDGIYECFPDITRLDSGELICVYRESEGHVPGEYTRIVTRTSQEEGANWGEKSVVSITKGSARKVPGWNCPRISGFGDGRCAIVCDSLRWPERGDLSRRSRIHLWVSDDGMAWEGGWETGATGIVPDRISPFGDEWFLGTHERSPETGKLRQILWRSIDKRSWDRAAVVADDPGLDLCEGSLVSKGPEMACLMRENSGRGLPGYISRSGDSGQTWTPAERTSIPGCHRPVAGWWGDEILVTFRCYAGAGMKNTLMMGALMDSETIFHPGESSSGRIFPIDYDRSPYPDTGYSGWCELPGGDVIVAYYINDDAPRAQIRSCRFSRDDLEFGHR